MNTKLTKTLLLGALTLSIVALPKVTFASEAALSKLQNSPDEYIEKVQSENIEAENGYIVTLKDNTSNSTKNSADSTATKASDMETLTPDKEVFKVEDINDVEALTSTDNIESIIKNEKQTIDATITFNDPLLPQQWALSAMKVDKLWADNRLGNKDIKVAVIDSGYSQHEDFNASNVIIKDENDVSDVKAIRMRDVLGHGTAVAGVITAQQNNKVGMVGAAPNVTIVPIRIFDDNGNAWTSNTIRALRRAIDENVDVINMSFSSGAYIQDIQDLINEAASKGIIMVASAGNYKSGDAQTPENLRYPASYDNVISVGAVDRNLRKASFSYTNPKVDVTAPGASVLVTTVTGGYRLGNGTSFSGPYVAALAGLVKSQDKSINASQFEQLMIDTTDRLGTKGKTNEFGWGLVNYEAALNKITPKKQSAKVVVSNLNINAGTFDIIATLDSSAEEAQSVVMSVFGQKNGKGDLKKYTAVRQNDGTYKVSVNIKDHNYEQGAYSISTNIATANYPSIDAGTITQTINQPSTTQQTNITNINVKAGTFDVIVSKINSPVGVKEVKLAVQSGKTTPKTYTAVKQANGTYKYTVNIKDHANSKLAYTVNTTIVQNNNIQVSYPAVKAEYTQPATATTTIKNLNVNAGTFDVIVSKINAPLGLLTVQVEVYGEVNGKNDAKVYTATKQKDGSYKSTVKISNHKYEQGKYIATTTIVQESSIKNVTSSAGVVVNQPSATAKTVVKNLNQKAGTFDVFVTDIKAPVGVKQIQVEVYGEVNGKNDAKWYTATKQKDGTYKVAVKISNHKYEQGKYIARTTIVQQNSIKNVTSSAGVVVNQPSATAKAVVKNLNQKAGTFDVFVTNVKAPVGVKQIQVAVWGDPSGQNDIKWYTATKQKNGTYKVTVKISNHKYEQGKYNLHVYTTQTNGIRKITTTTTTKIATPKPGGAISISKVNKKQGTFDITLSKISAPMGAKTVKVAVWGNKNGKNDIKWYNATKQKNGTYKVTINKKNHKKETGKYNVQLHITQNDNKTYYVTSKTTTL